MVIFLIVSTYLAKPIITTFGTSKEERMYQFFKLCPILALFLCSISSQDCQEVNCGNVQEYENWYTAMLNQPGN